MRWRWLEKLVLIGFILILLFIGFLTIKGLECSDYCEDTYSVTKSTLKIDFTCRCYRSIQGD